MKKDDKIDYVCLRNEGDVVVKAERLNLEHLVILLKLYCFLQKKKIVLFSFDKRMNLWI